MKYIPSFGKQDDKVSKKTQQNRRKSFRAKYNTKFGK